LHVPVTLNLFLSSVDSLGPQRSAEGPDFRQWRNVALSFCWHADVSAHEYFESKLCGPSWPGDDLVLISGRAGVRNWPRWCLGLFGDCQDIASRHRILVLITGRAGAHNWPRWCLGSYDAIVTAGASPAGTGFWRS
jgi:hypothetical protein